MTDDATPRSDAVEYWPSYGECVVELNARLTNLNGSKIPLDWPREAGEVLQDWSCLGSQELRVHFRDLAMALEGYIAEADLVVGCVAWLTHEGLLRALASVPEGVALVVQKEDFLRPDMQPVSRTWSQWLRAQYATLPAPPNRYEYAAPLRDCTTCGEPEIDPVRCVGNYNEDHAPAFPRMHHKFLVFCRMATRKSSLDSPVEPYAVWTGSFNLTQNATNSLENALYITTPAIVQAYYHEWAQIEALSEPLDWEHVWVTPEWRLGS
jgi:hypothetical protein